ncbi:MAG: hypothetical protein R2873_19655 [Caldilineaceae bacterium]
MAGQLLHLLCPELSNAFHRAGIEFQVVSGTLFDDERAWSSLREWCQAATAVRKRMTLRLPGPHLPRMLDIIPTFTQHHAQLGLHVEVLEMDDLADRANAVTQTEIDRKLEEARQVFEIDASAKEEDLQRACKVAAGLDRLRSTSSWAGWPTTTAAATTTNSSDRARRR